LTSCFARVAASSGDERRLRQYPIARSFERAKAKRSESVGSGVPEATLQNATNTVFGFGSAKAAYMIATADGNGINH